MELDSTVIGANRVVSTNAGFDSGTQTYNHSVDNEIGAYVISIRPAGLLSWPGTSDLALMCAVVHWEYE